VDGFSVKQARSEERQLIAGTWAMTLSKTRRTEHLARIHEKLMSVPDGERSVDHWRQVCRELEDPKGASFEALLEQTFKEIRDVSLGETAKPIVPLDPRHVGRGDPGIGRLLACSGRAGRHGVGIAVPDLGPACGYQDGGGRDGQGTKQCHFETPRERST
jgi:hypothetical protein